MYGMGFPTMIKIIRRSLYLYYCLEYLLWICSLCSVFGICLAMSPHMIADIFDATELYRLFRSHLHYRQEYFKKMALHICFVHQWNIISKIISFNIFLKWPNDTAHALKCISHQYCCAVIPANRCCLHWECLGCICV